MGNKSEHPRAKAQRIPERQRSINPEHMLHLIFLYT